MLLHLRMIRRSRRLAVVTSAALALAVTPVAVDAALGATATPTRPIKVNQTDGYGDGKLTAFTYFMNFQCVTEPFDDLDHDGVVAAADPEEFQRPHCLAGEQPTLDPTGDPIDGTEPLYVIVPFFDADNDGQAANAGLGGALRSLFGMVPDAFDPSPGVPVQCPEPGPPLTEHTGDFGTCTMHPSQIDLGPVLGQLGKVPADTVVTVPTPNHSHIIDGVNFGKVWWQVQVVLVNDPAVWPDVAGTRGLTSVEAMRAAQRAGKASADIPTNFFLFFDSQELKTGASAMHAAHTG